MGQQNDVLATELPKMPNFFSDDALVLHLLFGSDNVRLGAL
jgi:hypothetical protein